MSELGRAALTPLMSEYTGIPEFYGLCLRARWRLIDILTKTKPKRILAFGAGTFVAVLSRYCAEMPGTVCTVVDASDFWHFERRKQWLENGVDMKLLDMRVVRMAGGAFDMDDLELDAPYDLILVDCPRTVEKRQDVAFISTLRKASVPQHTTIILDDAHYEAVSVLKAALLEHLGSWNVEQETITDERVLNSHRTTAILHPRSPTAVKSPCDICMVGWNNHPDRLRAFERSLLSVRLNWTAYEPVIYMAQETRSIPEESIRAVEDVGAKYGVQVLNNPADHSWVHNKRLSWSKSTAPYIMFLEDDWIMQYEFDIRLVTDWLDEHTDYHIINVRMHHPKAQIAANTGSDQFGDFFERVDKQETVYTCTPHIRRRDLPIFESDKIKHWATGSGGKPQTLENGMPVVWDAELAFCELLEPAFRDGSLRVAAFNHLYLFEHHNEAVAKKTGKAKQDDLARSNQK